MDWLAAQRALRGDCRAQGRQSAGARPERGFFQAVAAAQRTDRRDVGPESVPETATEDASTRAQAARVR
eukprot:10572188-Alexandrium_andersonii.AAC.1